MYRWLNQFSELFLGRDYLSGLSVDERVSVIFENAESILKKKGFAKKAKGYFQKGWFSLSTPIWANFGNDRGLPISCVTGETWINTRHDGGKQAKDIKIGDEVLTHKGRYRPVTNVMVTENQSDIYRLKVAGRMTNLYLTGNHLVLTNLGWVRTDELDPQRHLVAINRELSIEEKQAVLDLRPYCNYEYVELNKRLYKKGEKTVRPDRRVDTVKYYSAPTADNVFDAELGWAFGLWFAEGSLTINNRKEPNGIRITVNANNEQELATKWQEIMERRFQVKTKAYESRIIRNGKENSWLAVNLNSGVIGRLFATFGKGCKEKTVPNWIMESPPDVLEAFLDGLLQGDGNRRATGEVKITLSNPKLILQTYQIGLRLGRAMSLQMQEKAGKLATTKHVYTVMFQRPTLSCRRAGVASGIPFVDGLTYAPIRTLERTERVDTVYDFTVEEDHSFSAAGVVLHNCFGSFIDDSIESLTDAWAEVCAMTKYGGGTSASFGAMRPRGAEIRNNGQSSGPVHFMELFDKLIQVISQGSCRRGNFAAYLPIDHPDIEEFLRIRTDGFPIQKLSFGTTISDAWMLEMIGDGSPQGGDREKRRIWAKVLEARANIGYPYLVFIDNMNNYTVDCYKNKGYRIHGSNLCVTGDQLAVTSTGLRRVRDLYETQEELTLFDGTKPVAASPMRLVERNVPIYKITTKCGRVHKVTGYHKVKTLNGMVEAKNLNPGDKICIQKEKGLFGDIHEPQLALMCLYHSDDELKNPEIPDWLWKADEYTQLVYVKELFLSHGEISSDKGQVLLVSTHLEFLRELQILLSNLGLYSAISQTENEFEFFKDLQILLSNLGLDSDIPQTKYQMNVLGTNILLGMPSGIYQEMLYGGNTNFFGVVKSVEVDDTDDVYCTTVDSEEHVWVCNGFITSNCTEIAEPTNNEESFVCDLLSLNDIYYDEWKNTDLVEVVTYFLDAVMTEFIEKGKNIKHLERAVRFAERHRALGIGQLGWHHLLQSKMIPFESMEAKFLNVEIAKNIYDQAYRASAKLAQEYGEPDVCKGFGRRNSVLLAIAPTKSSSFILGQASEGVEPQLANYYIQDLQKGKFTIKNPYLEKVLQSKGRNCDEVWQDILSRAGSVQHLSFLTDDEKAVFKTFAEISQKEIIIQAAQRQKYIDQAQSLNLMIHPSIPIKDVNQLIIFAWQSGIKSLYYQKSVNAAQHFSRNILSCASCEA